MNLEQIQQQYPDEWVIIEFSELDDDLKVINGEVIAHSPDRLEMDRQLMDLRNQRLAIEYTGKGDADEAYLL